MFRPWLIISWVQMAVQSVHALEVQVSSWRNTRLPSVAPLLEAAVTDDPVLGVLSRGFVHAVKGWIRGG